MQTSNFRPKRLRQGLTKFKNKEIATLSLKESIRHREKLEPKKLKLIEVVTLLMGLAQAFLIYVLSSYFKMAAGTENVGPFYFVSYSIALVCLLNFHKLVKKLGKSQVLYFSLIFKIIAMAFLLNLPPSWWTIGLLMVYMIFESLQVASLDIIIESFSVDRLSGRIRGLHLTFLNAGFLLGPFLSTRILESLDFQGIFLFLFIFNAVIFLASLLGLRQVNHKFNRKLTVLGLLKKVAKLENVRRIYYISFALEFFYALTVIYTPIYLLDLGLGWEEIGIIFTAMLVPFVIVQYPLGIMADRRWGEKELIIASLLIMGVSTGLIYFVSSTSVVVWSVVLFSTRIGAAILEVMRDSYFYKKIDGHDVDLINFFRTAMPVGFILGTGLSFLFLLLFPIKIIFLIVALVSFLTLIPAILLVDNKCEKEL